MPCPPFQPFFIILERWFWQHAAPMPSTPTGCEHPQEPLQPDSWWEGDLDLYLPFLHWLSTLFEAPHLQMSLPQAHRRSCTSLVCGGWGIGGATLGLYPKSGYDCGGIGTWVGHLPCSISQCSTLTCWQPPVPIDVPPWLPGGPYCGAGPFLRPGSEAQSVDWAMG